LRAFTALGAVLLVAAWILVTVGVEPSPGHGFAAAAEFAVRDSLAVLRTPTPDLPLTAVGTVVDISLRLVGPLLIGLGLLALRGRTRR
jgi:hypothetical protein